MAAEHRRRLLLGAAVWALAPSVPGASGARAAATSRSALILGNARYPGAALKNAGKDAQLMHAVAGELGFSSTLLLDSDLMRMIEEVQRWLAASSASTTRLLYYAGHGAQYRGRNYLIPVDAELRSEDDLPGRALEVDGITDRLSRLATGVNLLVLDACRSAPMLRPPPGSRQRAGAGRAPAPGLAALQAPRGTLVAYATAPGALAADDPTADHSPYTRHLAAQMRLPGVPIETVFKRTRAAVLQETRGTQVPWETSSLVGELCLAGAAAPACGPAGAGR